MTTSKGRIAQTFPDINSTTGPLTQGTAAGIRSFPEPFIAIPGGVEVLIQNASVTIPVSTRTATAVLGTTVDVTKSFIVFRGVNHASGTGSPFTNCWRQRMDFRNIIADMSFEVRSRRSSAGFGINLCQPLDVYFTVVTFTGTNTDSGDIRIERGFATLTHPATTGTFVLPGPQLTPGELTSSFVYTRGADWAVFPQTIGDPCSSGGLGLNCWKHPEQQRGSVELKNVGPSTVVEYTRFTAGDTSTPGHCGSSDMDVYFTVVIFP